VIIKRAYVIVIPLIETRHPIDPLDKEEPSLPLTVGVKHIRYQSRAARRYTKL